MRDRLARAAGMELKPDSFPSEPLISCVMPTYGRRRLVDESVAMFLAQDYPNKELVLLNDCPGQELRLVLPNIKVVNVSKRFRTLGEKRNAAISLATGNLIAVWDDDDVYLPWRLSYSWEKMKQSGLPLYMPQEFWAYWGSEQLEVNTTQREWISHPPIMFVKELWRQAGGYPDRNSHEDTFLMDRMFHLLGHPWQGFPIEPHDRFYIMRGQSPYQHTSIDGGLNPADTQPGSFQIQPTAIRDASLGAAVKQLEQERMACLQRLQSTSSSPLNHPADATMKYLDQLAPASMQVGYGQPGLGGSLGYEQKQVEVQRRPYLRALSLHAPATVTFALPSGYQSFCAHVAINDDVIGFDTSADFCVYKDEQLVGVATNVRPGEKPRRIVADIAGGQQLKLVTRARRWDYCHSVWLDPAISTQRVQDFWETDSLPEVGVMLTDAIGQAYIQQQELGDEIPLAVVTAASPGWEDWVDDLLGSICANAQLPEAQLVVFAYGWSARLAQIAEKYQAWLVPCQAQWRLSPASKSVLYSAARVIPARKIIALDADALVLDDLRPIVQGIDLHNPGSVLVCHEAYQRENIAQTLTTIYEGQPGDLQALLAGNEWRVGQDHRVINDGFFAGSRAALLAVDEFLRGMHLSKQWVDHGPAWRNQMVFNLALARLDCCIEVDDRFNVQLNRMNLDDVSRGPLDCSFAGRRPAVVHFNGTGRDLYPELRGHYSKIQDPLVRSQAIADNLHAYLDALRRWVGQSGQSTMTWSFYGTSDGENARITDSNSFSLLSTLYYLIRSNGCVKVLECGTAKGVSTACMAAAVAHHSRGQVTTLDPNVDPARDRFWAQLPYHISQCIEAISSDSVTGMHHLLASQQRFHAALLDSIHTREQVMAEFELARQLVCAGGLILIHDPLLAGATVEAAVREIAALGYPVTHLWAADEGVRYDDRLGLAVVENRPIL